MKKICFLYMNAFSVTGGIEKFNSSFLKALNELSNESCIDPRAYSMYDAVVNEKYFSKQRFRGFSGSRVWFVLYAVFSSFKFDKIILGHINLAPVGWLIRKINPKAEIILIAHGIEVWEKQANFKAKLLKLANEIWCVSHFTKTKMTESNPGINPEKVSIFPNTIDEHFSLPDKFEKPEYLLKRYNLTPRQKIILTVTRLSSSEKYKGYDNVIKVLAKLTDPDIRYIMGGKADEAEMSRVENLIKQYNAESLVNMTGYIKDEELTDHYLLADVFIMPSKGEGFGIVFIEAMACGCKVIAGNKDGSTEALQHGALGTLIDPDDPGQIEAALRSALSGQDHNPAELQQKVLNTFGFPVFRQRLKKYLGCQLVNDNL